MPAQLDVYRDWLQIADTDRPLNHYQLLRLKKFEDDFGKIRNNYRQLNAHVRKYAAGDFAQQSQDLLNELSRAMLCLTDARRKGEYDASLGRTDAGGGRKLTFEQLLLGRKVVDQEQLARARSYADSLGVELRDAIVQQKFAKPELVMPVFAESIGLPYVDLLDLEIEPTLFRRLPALLAREHSLSPVLMDGKQFLIASPLPLDPEIEDQLRLKTGLIVRGVLCTAAAANSLINQHYPREAAAAELAAQTAAAGKARPAAAADDASPVVAAPRNEDAQAERLKMALVGFNLGAIASVLIFNTGLGWSFIPATVVMVVLIGGVGAAAGFFMGGR